ncbi:MAG: ribonuclease Z [Bacteroidia bacterium]
MSIHVTILGCGSATPTLFRNPTSQWLEIHGHYYLIDCGEGTQTQLLKYRLKMSKLKAVFISHLHGDHFFGLPGLISSMHLMGRREKLKVFGPPGLFEILDGIFKHSETELRFPIEYHQIDTSHSASILESDSYTISSLPLRHRIPCSGFLFQEKTRPRNLRPEMIKFYDVPVAERKKIKKGADFININGDVIPNEILTLDPSRSVSYAFCSDTAPNDDLLPLIKHVTALYHEATFEDELLERAQLTFHSTASQAAEVAKQAEVEQLFIGHFSSRYRDTEIIESQAKAIFANTKAVHDGFVFEVM